MICKDDEAVKSPILTTKCTKNTKGQKIFNNFSFVLFVSFVVSYKHNFLATFYELIKVNGFWLVGRVRGILQCYELAWCSDMVVGKPAARWLIQSGRGHGPDRDIAFYEECAG